MIMRGTATCSVTSAGRALPRHTTCDLPYAGSSCIRRGVMYRGRSAAEAQDFSAFFHRLPALSTVDDIAQTAAGVGFTLLSLGIVTGVIWSSARGGRVWHNDPKEIFAVLTWLLYLTMIHYRSQWRGRKAAWAGVAGFALVLFTFLGTRLMGGYHVFG